MKRISVIIMAVLLTLCGVRAMASFLSLTGWDSSDEVTIASVSVKAGSTFTVPVSLANSNTGFVAFEMTVQLPQGVTPVYDDEGYIAIEKSDRLNSSHDFSSTYNAKDNSIKLVCSSLRNAEIKESSGELFYLVLKSDTSMTSGDYQIACKSITFSTSTVAPEGAVSYKLPDATAIISVAGSGPVVTTSWSIIFNEKDVYEIGTVPGSFSDGDFILGVSDGNGKMSIDPNNSRFGTIDDYTMFSYRLKTSGKSSNSQYLTLSIPQSGLLRIFARSASNSATDRTVVLTQDGKEIYNNVVSEYDAIEKTETDGAGEEVAVKIYPVIEVPVQAGIVEVGFPVGGINFYGFQLVANGSAETIEKVSVPFPISVKAGDSFMLPVSLENSNTNYVGFQMDIVLPWGVRPMMDGEYAIIDTSSRLDGSHTFNAAYDEWSNRIKLVCSSMDNAKIMGTSGELFYLNLYADASMTAGNYQMSFNNIVFSTNSDAPEGAKSYTLPDASYLSISVIDYPQSYYELNDTIEQARNILSHPALKAEGYNLLEAAIATAQQALETVDDSTMIAAIVTLNDTKAFVQEKYMLPYETLSLRSIDGSTYSYHGTETFEGQNVTLTPMPENGSYPRLTSSYLRLYYNNKLVIISEDNIVKLVFDANRTLAGSFSTGEWVADNQWAGNANEVELYVEIGSFKYYNIFNLTVVYETVDAEALLARLTAQIAAAEDTIQSLAFANVPGASALDSLITVAKTTTIETEASVIKSYINQFKNMIEDVVEMDQQYQALETLLQKVETAAQNNEGADASYVAEVTTKILEVRAALNSGAYNIEDLWIITELMNSYLNELSKVYLSIHVEEPGTLAALIAEKGFEPNSVLGLIVSGSLNSDDMDVIRNMYDLEKIDMSETDVTEIPSQMFYYRSALRTVVLPKNLLTIGYYAFYGCSLLTEITLSESLQSIGYWAFGYCENLKSITSKVFTPIALYDYFMSEENANQCMLYVPAIAVEAYRNAYFWQYFKIQGTDVMPENITVTSNLTIDWPANLDSDYKPNVRIAQSNNSGAYGALTVNGENIMSMNDFSMVWAPYNYYSQYNSETSRYEYYRYSHASLIANTPMRADNVSVELYTRTYRWDFISFPFDVKVSDITNLTQTNAPLVIRRYDGEKRANVQMGETWVDMDAESTLEAGKGYIWQSADGDEGYSNNTFSVPALNNSNKNGIFTMNNVTVQLNEYDSEFSQNRSWNLIGNPYPAFYDIRYMQTTAPITIWNGYNGVYEAYTPGDDNYILNPGQAFFIQRPINQESITFLKEGRQTDLTVGEMNDSIGRRAAANSERYVFNLILSGSEETQGDRTRIVIDATAKMDYEAGRDASKFMSPEASAAQLFTTVGGLRYAINNRPLSDGIVELGLSIGTTGSYTIALSTKVEGEVYLIDRETGAEIRLDGSEGYTFQATKGIIEGRFAVRFGNGDLTGIKGVANDGKDAGNWYNMKGQRVNAPAKGIYIQNGKKTVVK